MKGNRGKQECQNVGYQRIFAYSKLVSPINKKNLVTYATIL